MDRWKRNLGSQPEETVGRRVYVKLRNGMMPPESWAADGKSGCNWARSGSDWDIAAYRLA